MLVVANWKMKLDAAQSVALAGAMVRQERILPADVEVVVCPSHVSLTAVGEKIKGSRIGLGAQDCFWEVTGAYTGEVSPGDVYAAGCRFVILGHSERRQHVGETDEQVHRKVIAALRAGLVPMVCVGEDWQQRGDQQKDYVLIRQLQTALQGVVLGARERLVVAYEPVWAISTGGVGIEATPPEVQYACEVIAHVVTDLFGAATRNARVPIIYGGSVNPSNVAAFTRLPRVAGVLVGAASLNVSQFVDLINAAAGRGQK